MEEKYGFVYIWFDKKHKRYYIGSHWGTEDDGYICSSTNMRENFKNRPDDFSKKILIKVYTTREDLLIEEQKWLDKVPREEFGKKYYNINARVQGYWWVNEETKSIIGKKISKAMNKIKLDHPEKWKKRNLKLSNASLGHQRNKGKRHSDETKQKISLAQKGYCKPHLAETKRKIGVANAIKLKGRKCTDTHRNNIKKNHPCNTKLFTIFNETKTIYDWINDPRCIVTKKVFLQRLKLNWSVEQALTKPKKTWKVEKQ